MNEKKSFNEARLILVGNLEIRHFTRRLTSHQMKILYTDEFRRINFSSKKLLQKIKHCRVKVEID
jgi:hypothetical protein